MTQEMRQTKRWPVKYEIAGYSAVLSTLITVILVSQLM